MSQFQAASSRAGATPVRRSARIGTASVADTNVQSIATNATPSRAGTQRKGALPKVKPRASNAYGASGRFGAAEQLSVPVTGFAQAFEAQRDQAVARDQARHEESEQESTHESIDELADESNNVPARSTAPSQQSEAPTNHRTYQSPAPSRPSRGLRNDGKPRVFTNLVPSRSSSPEEDETASMTPSIMNTSKSFGMDREAGMSSSFSIRANGLAQNARRGLDLSGRQHLPPPLFETSSQSAQIRSRIVRPQRPQSERPNVPRPNGHFVPDRRDQDEDEDEDEEKGLRAFWMETHPVLKGVAYAIATVLLALLLTSPAAVNMMAAFTGRLRNAYDVVRGSPHQPGSTSVVPPPVVTSSPPKDEFVDRAGRKVGEPGYVTFVNRLWSLEDKAAALEDHYADLEGQSSAIEKSLNDLEPHLPPFLVVTRHRDNSIEINDEFWRALVSKMQSEGLSGPSNSADLDWNTFLEKNQQKILRVMSDEIKASDIRGDFEIVARGEFTKLMQQEYSKLSSLVDKKVEEAVRSISKKVAQEVAHKAFQDEMRIQSLAIANLVANADINLRKVNYFSLGLGAWIDPMRTSSTFTDVGTPLARFYNLFVSSPKPSPITALERWDEPGECWCAAPDEKKLGKAQLTINLGYPVLARQMTIEHLPKQASLDFTTAPKDIEVWAESDETKAAAPNCSEGPQGFICLGKFSYNVHSDNHIQTFDLDAIVTKPITKTVVRVTENWGSDHTCLYRLRLHGDPVST